MFRYLLGPFVVRLAVAQFFALVAGHAHAGDVLKVQHGSSMSHRDDVMRLERFAGGLPADGALPVVTLVGDFAKRPPVESVDVGVSVRNPAPPKMAVWPFQFRADLKTDSQRSRPSFLTFAPCDLKTCFALVPGDMAHVGSRQLSSRFIAGLPPFRWARSVGALPVEYKDTRLVVTDVLANSALGIQILKKLPAVTGTRHKTALFSLAHAPDFTIADSYAWTAIF